MKKYSTWTLSKLVIGLFLSSLAVGCAKTAEEGAGSTDPGTPKALLSSWAIGNSAWAVRLDVGANNTGTDFMIIYKFSDNSEVHCTGNLNGTESSGTYSAGTCTDPGAGMASGQASIFDSGGAGTYSNDGTYLQLCRHSGTCLTYH